MPDDVFYLLNIKVNIKTTVGYRIYNLLCQFHILHKPKLITDPQRFGEIHGFPFSYFNIVLWVSGIQGWNTALETSV